ncbi:MAG: hypothetical protein QNJ13_02355 [Paracoccaceae bacterium]|nr:hypothetical protein [Paracoccaceae bacterium]
MTFPFRAKKRRLPLYQCVLRAAAAVKPELHVVIVGANDGRINDPAYALLTGDLIHRTRVTLIEPQADLIPILREHYAGHPNARVLQQAIGEGHSLDLYSVAPEIWPDLKPPYAKGWPDYRAPTGVTSSDRDHVVRWARNHLRGRRWSDEFVKHTATPCSDLAGAFAAHGIAPPVDVLQIDAEGQDDAVLHACNLDTLRPGILHFEAKHIPAPRFAKLRGTLEAAGYVV